MKSTLMTAFLILCFVASGHGQSSMTCSTPKPGHQVCEFDNGDVIETVTVGSKVSVFHYNKTDRAMAKPFADHLKQGMTVNDAYEAAKADAMRDVMKEDLGVLKARIGLCRDGVLKGDRCFGLVVPD
jgi:hypothetical protein